MNRLEELSVKLERVRGLLKSKGLGGLLLRTRANFAWITCGGHNYVSVASETGIGSVLVTAERVYLLANNIENRRLVEEELAGLPIEAVEFPWWEPEAEGRAIARLVKGPVATDWGSDYPNVAGEVMALRYPMTDSEIGRYIELGAFSSRMLEQGMRQILPGMTEFEVAAQVEQGFVAQGVLTPVLLVAADERLTRRRHPIPKHSPVSGRVMVVVCAEAAGLWCNLTRIASLHPLDEDIRRRHKAVCEVEASAIAATRPGASFADVWKAIVAEYARQGFDGEWKLHHQGGSTGYNGRDVFNNPTCPERVVDRQAYAWNPSITGTKSEDTFLADTNGFRFITQPQGNWPLVACQRGGITIHRADILQLG